MNSPTLAEAQRLEAATVDEIVRAAETCPAPTVIQPYLEALVT